jgi:hypothetical protein
VAGYSYYGRDRLMSKIQCKCENTISISGLIPNPNEILTIMDHEFESLREINDNEMLYLKMKSIFICNRCDRLWFFNNGFNEAPTSYKKEE